MSLNQALQTLKVGLVLASNSKQPLPSTRVAVLNIRPMLQSLGIETHILFEPHAATETPEIALSADAIAAAGFKVICFQKVRGPSVLALARDLGRLGVRTVFVVCDLVETSMADVCDATVAVTDYLASLYPAALRAKLHVVHDGIEQPAALRRRVAPWRATAAQPLNAVLVTSSTLSILPMIGDPPPWLKVTVVGRYSDTGSIGRLRDAQWRIRHAGSIGDAWRTARFMLHPRIRCVQWHPTRVYEHLADADIGIIPIERVPSIDPTLIPPTWAVKSENRLTLKMSMALPVVATPIPAYESVIQQGANGFLASSPQEWNQCLELLRDPQVRQDLGTAAREAVSQRFSMEAQARALAAILRRIA